MSFLLLNAQFLSNLQQLKTGIRRIMRQKWQYVKNKCGTYMYHTAVLRKWGRKLVNSLLDDINPSFLSNWHDTWYIYFIDRPDYAFWRIFKTQNSKYIYNFLKKKSKLWK